MAVAHVWPFGTVGAGRHYDSDPFYKSPVTAPGAVTSDERPGDYLEECYSSGGYVGGHGKFVIGEKPSPMDHPAIVKRFAELSRDTRYPAPTTAELVTLWKRGQQAVLSITADGKVHDFHLPPARLVYLLREVAEQLAENSILK